MVGEHTRALGAHLTVARTGVHPLLAADPCAASAIMGAVQVRLGATAGFVLLTIRDNDMIIRDDVCENAQTLDLKRVLSASPRLRVNFFCLRERTSL